MAYNEAEYEVIGLCIALEALGDMVNHALLDVRPVARFPGEAEVYFQSRPHQQLFLIRLLDFAKEGGDARITGVQGSCLDVLKAAARSMSFDVNGSVTSLSASVAALDEWLQAERPLRLWLPTLDIEATLNIPRIDFLFIAGNQSKHNLSRLTGVSQRIAQTLQRHGHEVQPELIPLALEDFEEHLHEDYFTYYGTWLTALLNDIRWGLQDYLRPVFGWSYTLDQNDPPRYSYRYPDSVVNDIPREWFWRLMNNVRSRPYVDRFKGAHYLRREVLR